MKIRQEDIDFILHNKWNLLELLESLDFGFTLEGGSYEYDCDGFRVIRLCYGNWKLLGSLTHGIVRFVKVEYIESEVF